MAAKNRKAAMMYGFLSISGLSGRHQPRKRQHRSFRRRSALRSARAGVLVFVFSGPAAWAQAPDPTDIAEGGRLFRQKANCQACHGWAGDGRKMDTQMPDGANLRETKLDRQDLVMVI